MKGDALFGRQVVEQGPSGLKLDARWFQATTFEEVVDEDSFARCVGCLREAAVAVHGFAVRVAEPETGSASVDIANGFAGLRLAFPGAGEERGERYDKGDRSEAKRGGS